ncbi:PqqD family peptide modification chaperone [Serratia marcescens]|uniref:PqqD family peptide modification chaperone n=1 Tax=Serratia TaxID=613 RepID=UPI0018D7AF17|nr:PqqD family peptide modification chaperone [Serratia marcescens]MBH2808135.1 PqqD family peptide modification chaperone [Serratia marcescens]MBN5236551.1 PqqD family peptide modification chaperone [Serratia marcescens]MBN5369058.1 PqqD family peptide modification chaperone [Serratia marcescens]
MPPASTLLRLNEDVKLVSPQANVALLLRENSNAPLKLSGFSARLAQQLQGGSSMAALLTELAEHHPNATPEQCQQALSAFLLRLKQANMIVDGAQKRSAAAKVAGRYRLPNPDRVAHKIATVLRVVPRGLGYGLLSLAIAAALWRFIACLPGLNAWLLQGEWASVQLLVMLVGIPLWLFLHEMAHAVVCRLYGCPVLGAGLQFRGWWLPSAFVNTSAIALFPQRGMKAWVAMAGPLMDLLCLGALAALSESAAATAIRPLLLLILFGLLFNLTPFRLSDATRAFRAFAQPGANKKTRVWSARGRRLFHSYCLLYSLCMAAAMGWLILVSWQKVNNWLASGVLS